MNRIVPAFLIVLSSMSANVARSTEPVTFNRDIAPLIFKNCATCHRPGEVAPFSLLTYADVQKRAKQIQKVTASKFMPPWKSVASHGPFIGERRLTADEIALIAQWVEQGSVQGEAKDFPPAPQFRDGWKLGTPDIILTLPEAYSIPADGPDIYRNFVLDLKIPAGKFIKAAEFRPSNRRVVHHAALAMDASDRSRKDDAADPAPGFKGSLNIPGQLLPGSLSAWTPGRDPLPLPEGFAFPWRAGADFVLQLHLHPSGKPELEQSQVGFFLTDEPPQRSMYDVNLIFRGINIPPGEKTYRTRDEFTLPIEMELFGLFPHMHLIGKEIKVTAHPPSGASFALVQIDDWDFNWQSYYQCEKPVPLPAGTRIVLEAVHDNSAENPRNPSQPPERVVWGEQTTNEMSAAMLQLVPKNESDLAQLSKLPRGRVLAAVSGTPSRAASPPGTGRNFAEEVQQALAKYDRDGDGKLNLDEIAAASNKPKDVVREQFTKFDTDNDGTLNPTELAAAMQALANK